MRAWVLSAATSEPPPTSLTAIAVTISPAMAGTRNSRRSSSLPQRARAGVAMSVCTPSAIGTEPLAQVPSSSVHTIEYE